MCGRAFQRKVDLRRHTDSQHGPTPQNLTVSATTANTNNPDTRGSPTATDLNSQLYVNSHLAGLKATQNTSPLFSYNSFSSSGSSSQQEHSKKPLAQQHSNTTSPGQLSNYASSPIHVNTKQQPHDTSANLNLTSDSNSQQSSPTQAANESSVSSGSQSSSKSKSNSLRKKMSYDPIGDEIRKLEQN